MLFGLWRRDLAEKTRRVFSTSFREEALLRRIFLLPKNLKCSSFDVRYLVDVTGKISSLITMFHRRDSVLDM